MLFGGSDGAPCGPRVFIWGPWLGMGMGCGWGRWVGVLTLDFRSTLPVVVLSNFASFVGRRKIGVYFLLVKLSKRLLQAKIDLHPILHCKVKAHKSFFHFQPPELWRGGGGGGGVSLSPEPLQTLHGTFLQVYKIENKVYCCNYNFKSEMPTLHANWGRTSLRPQKKLFTEFETHYPLRFHLRW